MYRKAFLILLLLTVAAFVTRPLLHASSSTTALLVETSPHSLRGESIDLDNTWSSARLLAHFGEYRKAYRVLAGRNSIVATDEQVERFEARLLTEIGMPARADSLLALQSSATGPDAYYVHCIRRARLNLLAGRPGRALDFIALVDTMTSATFEPYKDYMAMEALYILERFNEAADVGELRLTQGIPLSLSPTFEVRLMESYLAAEDYNRAARFIKLLKMRRKQMRTFAPLLVKEVDLMFAVGDTTGALESALNIAQNRHTRHYGGDVVERVNESIPTEQLTDEALLEFTSVLLRSNDLAGSDAMMTELLGRSLQGNDVERRRLYQADLYYKEKRYSRSFALIQNGFEDASLERNATLLRARIYRKIGQPKKSADAYVEFGTRYPYDSIAPEALFVASDLYLRVGDRAHWQNILERVIKTYPSSRYARSATMKMSVYYGDRGQYTRAIATLEDAVERSNRRNQEFLYYLAEAYRRGGKKDKRQQILTEIAELNSISFYLEPRIAGGYVQPIIDSDGQVALYGDDGLMPFLKAVFSRREIAYGHVREVLDPLQDADSPIEGSVVYLARGRTFLQMGFRDWAELELQVLERGRIPARVSFELGVLYDDFAMHWKSVRAFQRVYYSLDTAVRRQLEAQFHILMYPVPYPAQVFENCARNHISPHLVYGMMREESKFEYAAVSRAGAIGLMQLMPQTGKEVANRLGVPSSGESSLLSPEVNLTFGIWYASHLLSRADDNPLMMLSAYNAGFGNARRWFGDGGGDTVTAVDGIDYRETQNYVKRIVESAHVYHAYYFNPEGPAIGAQ